MVCFHGIPFKSTSDRAGGGSRQSYLICPAQLAEALEMEKGEEIEWVVEDKYILVIRRRPARGGEARRHER